MKYTVFFCNESSKICFTPQKASILRKLKYQGYFLKKTYFKTHTLQFFSNFQYLRLIHLYGNDTNCPFNEVNPRRCHFPSDDISTFSATSLESALNSSHAPCFVMPATALAVLTDFSIIFITIITRNWVWKIHK